MMYNGKSRHIRWRHNTVRELLSSGIITVDYVKSKDNVSDPLTKGLSREGVERTSKGMSLRPRTSQQGGSIWLKAICACIIQDLKMDPKKKVAKIALFLGKPFGNEEDPEIVLKKCALERLKNLEVNKSGSLFSDIHNSSFFRTGVVGDWKNHMSPEMEEQLNKITSLKLQGSDLEL
ncbi:putative cytosolic sulfotransferase 5-like isoform 2 [Capsicum annuum]|nr:putative cytosolic sulfotransferase 5-like isoform 2 [Capsicum annuum]